MNVNPQQHPHRLRRIARPVLGSAASIPQIVGSGLLAAECATVVAVLGCVLTVVPPQEPVLIIAASAALVSTALLSLGWRRFGPWTRAYATFLIAIDAWFLGNALERLI
jgi:hypothetical protein